MKLVLSYYGVEANVRNTCTDMIDATVTATSGKTQFSDLCFASSTGYKQRFTTVVGETLVGGG